MRTHFSSAPGTPNSWQQSRGTSSHPNCLAARAGNSALRSGVVVKMALATSSGAISFWRIIKAKSCLAADRISSRELESATVAPRTPRQIIWVSSDGKDENNGSPFELVLYADCGVSDMVSRLQSRHLPHFGAMKGVEVKKKLALGFFSRFES